MCRHEADHSQLDQRAHDAFGADPAIVRVRAVKNLVEQKQQRHRAARRLRDRSQAEDLGVEPRLAFCE